MEVPSSVKAFIMAALEEDIGSGDITSRLIVPAGHESTAMLVAKEGFVLAGLPFVEEVFHAIDGRVVVKALAEEGSRLKKGDIVAEISGKTKALLMGERVALNILQHLSGIATTTNRFVVKMKGLKTKLLDTRKTTPCMRFMEKYAVRMGGGKNHRSGLYDGILIKDNHVEIAGGIKEALKLAEEGRYLSRIEVEVENLKEFREALQRGADIIMLDNMPLKDIKEAVRLAKGRTAIEVSGNVTLENIREIAETGADLISVGCITHSAPAVDISMKIVRGGRREIEMS